MSNFQNRSTALTADFERIKRALKQERKLEIAELESTCTKLDRKIDAHNTQVLKLIREEHLEWRRKSSEQLKEVQVQIAKCRMEAMNFRQTCIFKNTANEKASERSSRLRILLIDSEYVLKKLDFLRTVTLQQNVDCNLVIQSITRNLRLALETILFELAELKKTENGQKVGEAEDIVMNVFDKVEELKLECEMTFAPKFDSSIKTDMEKVVAIVKSLLK